MKRWSGSSRPKECWQILLAASKADSAVERAVTAGEPAHVANYAFQLAQTFNNFYHQYPVLAEPDRERKVFLLWMTRLFPPTARAHARRFSESLLPAYM